MTVRSSSAQRENFNPKLEHQLSNTGFIVPGGTKSSSNLTNIALVVFMTLATFLIFFEDGKLNRMNVEFYRRYLGLDGAEEEKTEEGDE